MFGKSVHAAGQQHDGFLALHVFQAIHGFKQSVEDVRFAEAWKIEMINPLHDFVLVLREIHLDAGLHVKGFEGNPVFLLQRWEKRGGPILPNVGEETTISAATELHEEDHGDGSFGGGEVGDGLRNAIIENAKVFFLEARDDVAVLSGSNYIEGDDGDVNGDGHACLRGLRSGGPGGFGSGGFLLFVRGRGAPLRARWGPRPTSSF